jgi:uncharacterized protein
MRLILLIMCLWAGLVSDVAWPAIDCSRAKTNADLMICSNSKLAAAQEYMAWSFRQALRRGVNQDLLRDSQRAWYENERNVCNDAPCLLKAFEERSAELDSY